MKITKVNLLILFLFVFCIFCLNSFGQRERQIENENKVKQSAVVKVNRANIRAQPNLKSPVIYGAIKGMDLQVIASKDEWFEVVITPKRNGWIHKSTVSVSKLNSSIAEAGKKPAAPKFEPKTQVTERELLQKIAKQNEMIIELLQMLVRKD